MPSAPIISLVAAAVVDDFEDFVSEVFRLTLACENIQLAKFLIAGGPAEYLALLCRLRMNQT